jgi:hypothetical protein
MGALMIACIFGALIFGGMYAAETPGDPVFLFVCVALAVVAVAIMAKSWIAERTSTKPPDDPDTAGPLP